MQNPTSIELPKTVSELREAIQRAIECAGGSPFKNENKLNEALAKSLKFKNYDSLHPLLIEKETIEPYQHDQSNGSITIDNTEIHEKVFDDDLVDYHLCNRKEHISELERCIGETYDYSNNNPNSETDREMMKVKLKELESVNDEFFFESINSGMDYVIPSKSPEEFNNICEEILEEHYKLKFVTYNLEQIMFLFMLKTNIEDKGHFECVDCGSEWSAAISEDELPEICPHCAKDLEVLEVSSLPKDEQKNYSNNWAVKHQNGNVLCFKHKYLALDLQKQYRELLDLY